MTSPAPTLTVILPVRDVELYLADMLISLERNADADLELIAIDDGSTDGTGRTLERARERFARMQVIRHETAAGLASARNVGLDAASGRYITFLDGDDWLAPGYLPRLVESIDTLGCDFVRVDHVQVRDRDRVTHLAPEARRNVVLDPASGILPAGRRTMVDYPYAWAGIYRRELGNVLRFPDGLHTAEDRPWIWRLHREASSYAVASLAGVFYRRLVANSLTQIGDARQLHFIDAFDLVLKGAAHDKDQLAKAARQFLAVLAHQVKLGHQRFTRPLRAELRTRARALLLELDPEALALAVPNDARQAVLRPLLPAGVLGLREFAS